MEKWQAYEAYLEANGWDVLPIKEFLRITGFLQVEGELAAHYDLDTYAALLRFLQAHNEESSFDEMVQWDGISLIPLVLLEHLKKKGEANRLYYGKHEKGLWDFIAGFMLGFTKGAASLTAGFVIFAGGTLKFFINMIFRPFKTGKETFDALCRIPGAIVNLFKAIKVAYQEKVINGNLFTMGEFFGGATFEGTAIVIPIGIAKELSWLARFENWLIRLHLPQKGILGLLTHGTRNVAVYAVRGMRMVEQKISQGVRFVVLRLTTTLRSVWGNIKGSVRKVIDSLGIKEFWDKLKERTGKGYKEANLKNIEDFVKGTKNFDDVLDDYAKLYTERINSNKPWSWNEDILGGKNLTIKQKRLIKEQAVSEGLIPEIKVKKVEGMRYGFADFAGVGIVKETVYLPESFWKLSDKEQFKWLDEQIGGHREGYTWHHTEIPGKMELVPFGIHNITLHNDGRSTGMWADAPR